MDPQPVVRHVKRDPGVGLAADGKALRVGERGRYDLGAGVGLVRGDAGAGDCNAASMPMITITVIVSIMENPPRAGTREWGVMRCLPSSGQSLINHQGREPGVQHLAGAQVQDLI